MEREKKRQVKVEDLIFHSNVAEDWYLLWCYVMLLSLKSSEMSLLCDRQIVLDMLSNALEINDIYVGNSKINLRLVGKKKRVVIAPKHMLSSNT